MLDPTICFDAMMRRDARFDGAFFTCVRSTGIYCRPVCPAPKPKRANCTFAPSAAAAEGAGFRPCRRCRPEAAPGSPAWTGTEATVTRALRLIEEGALDTGSVEDLSARLGIGPRHLRRLFVTHLGAAPKAIAQTQRLHLAKRLIETSDLPMTEVAAAAGFQSLRRFNDAFSQAFRQAPTEIRRQKPQADDFDIAQASGLPCAITLPYRPPFDADQMLRFLSTRAIQGMEMGDGTLYARSIGTPAGPGLVLIRADGARNRLIARLALPSAGTLRSVAGRLRRLFDLDADSTAIDGDLARDPGFADQIARRPGIRVPGAWSLFEIAVRAVVGQQVSVKGAATLTARIVERFGTPLPAELQDLIPGVTCLFPTPEVILDGDLSGLGLTGKRIETLQALAHAFTDGPLAGHPPRTLEECAKIFTALPGIGPWTAQYIAMRGLGEPDAFPATDLGVLKALGMDLSASGKKALSERSETWGPWRSYATMRLWAGLEEKTDD